MFNIQKINCNEQKKVFQRGKIFSLPEIKVQEQKKQSLYEIMLS